MIQRGSCPTLQPGRRGRGQFSATPSSGPVPARNAVPLRAAITTPARRTGLAIADATASAPKGSSAPRARKGFPQSSALRLCRPPLRFALSTLAIASFQGWGYPSPCACYPPPSPGGVRHVCHMPLPKRQKQRSHDNAVSSSAHSNSPRTSEPS